jgi:hypothetical protein
MTKMSCDTAWKAGIHPIDLSFSWTPVFTGVTFKNEKLWSASLKGELY